MKSVVDNKSYNYCNYNNYQTYVVLSYLINVVFLCNIILIMTQERLNSHSCVREYNLQCIRLRVDSESVCPICLEECSLESLNLLEETVSLPCDHTFHETCIKRWICKSWMCTQTPTCPMCRSECC